VYGRDEPAAWSGAVAEQVRAVIDSLKRRLENAEALAKAGLGEGAGTTGDLASFSEAEELARLKALTSSWPMGS